MSHSLKRTHIFGTLTDQDPVLNNAVVQAKIKRAKKPVVHLGSVEDVLDGQHGDDGEHLLTAAEVDGHDEHLTKHGLQRELSHLEERAGGRDTRKLY